MKLLAINGSPRKGNTSNALNLIRDAFPGIDFEILHLIDLDFKLCKGCYACVLKGESKCPLKDKGDYYYETKIPFYKKIIAKKLTDKIINQFG
jgi:multimeric flavodoxin WrbA